MLVQIKVILQQQNIFTILEGNCTTCFGIQKDFNIAGFSDSDRARQLDDRKLINGNLFVYGDGAISWLSKNQPIVTFSTSEADYIALSYAVQEAIWQQIIASHFGRDCR